ncbi:MAG: EVE domain-containing protein [Saprospiraceae bacterium]|nr:EVE domain-containing protein [Candidatus Defluviibacterium haderslevense]
MNEIKYILVNISWNSKDWKGVSEDKSGFKYVSEGNIPSESWNFDFNNKRNTSEFIYGFGQFTNPPTVEGNNNLIIFYSQNHIVGFYGKAEVLSKNIVVNKQETCNLMVPRPLCILLKNKIEHAKEKGYLENLKRVGMIGFSYLKENDTINAILNEAILLNPEEKLKLNSLAKWLQLGYLPAPNYWVFQANPTKVYRIIDALKVGLLQSWMVNQYKKEIQTGDKVILWVSGETAGIYALATVSSPYILHWWKKRNINILLTNQKLKKEPE